MKLIDAFIKKQIVTIHVQLIIINGYLMIKKNQNIYIFPKQIFLIVQQDNFILEKNKIINSQ